MDKCTNGANGFMDTASLAGEQKLINDIYSEFVQLYGIPVSYYEYGYQLSAHYGIYGEMPTAPFAPPVAMKMIAQVNDDALLLSKFGIMAQTECQMIVNIQDFATAMGNIRAEPIVGSLVRLDFMDQRPGGKGFPNQQQVMSAFNFCKNPDEYQTALNNWLSSVNVQDFIRSAPIYEITQKRDYMPNKNLNILGTYSNWYLELIRWDYTYEPNAPREAGSNQVSDETTYGKLSGGTPVAEPAKPYTQDIPGYSNPIWDYETNGNRDSVYGEFE